MTRGLQPVAPGPHAAPLHLGNGWLGVTKCIMTVLTDTSTTRREEEALTFPEIPA